MANDATFIVLQNDMIFCGVAVVPIGKLFETNTVGRQWGKSSTAECPLLD
jgi:hypothetical protein